MAIWDNFGRKASETTSKALNQARALTETSRLNALISEEEKKIKKLYFLIGKKYVERHRDDYEDELTRYFEMLFESEESIERSSEKIQRIKGIIRCNSCGGNNGATASFCSSCGAALPKLVDNTDEEATFVCPNCGEEIEVGMRFCTNCGQLVDFEEDDSNDDTEDGHKELGYRCSQCGALMDEGDTFCIECGAGL